MKFKYLPLLLILLSGVVQAYDFGDGLIDIPDGFEGPVSKNLGQGARSAAFTHPHGSDGGALLQITTWDPGQDFPQMTLDELKAGSEEYLLQFLGGVEQRREEFNRQEVEFVQISGHPVAKVAWNGKMEGRDVHGVMYCLIVNSKIYSFHTQDFSSFNGEYVKKATRAFESIELKR